MSTDLTLGSDTFSFPENNENPGYGEDVHDWAVKATEVLNSLSTATDIPLTSATIANNQASPVNISGMAFSTTTVRSFKVTYTVVRTDVGFTTVVQDGTISGVYDGSSWTLTDDHNNNADVSFVITSGGQVQYYSSEITISGSYSGVISFKATSFAQ